MVKLLYLRRFGKENSMDVKECIELLYNLKILDKSVEKTSV